MLFMRTPCYWNEFLIWIQIFSYTIRANSPYLSVARHRFALFLLQSVTQLGVIASQDTLENFEALFTLDFHL
jgi:hypothetical protein